MMAASAWTRSRSFVTGQVVKPFLKGEAIGEFRGVNSLSFVALERVTGRDHQSLKSWHDLLRI